jgi:hypothetical protein
MTQQHCYNLFQLGSKSPVSVLLVQRSVGKLLAWPILHKLTESIVLLHLVTEACTLVVPLLGKWLAWVLA